MYKMKVGIEPKVCDKVKCKFLLDTYEMMDVNRNILIKCELLNAKCGEYYHQECPVPKKCPNKNLHIISGCKIKYCSVTRGEKCPEPTTCKECDNINKEEYGE